MKLSIREKEILYAFACPNYHNTVTRLKYLTALTVDSQAKHRMLDCAKRRPYLVKENIDYEEDFYDEAA